MTRLLRLLLLALVLALLAGSGAAAWASSPPDVVRDPQPYVPPARTIVQVEGDSANGFTITHFDGTQTSPPTDSETIAECNEYDAHIDRVRCRVGARTWMKAWAGFKETTLYYRFRG
ncbi:hypothetical protein F0U44_11805 [Nocardioides humilatus]|uniref:Uncharacterized protein n=1 Tax=Nocardioides humilatus TaxID=2607660 RepID=A0A5B1LES6_9ACTN|nr:hypothetical protein [Nocardioides humilatus]KAA1419132.1 hypothetical protein F0U44_11805 [Nocardioides humilatus]